MVREQNPNLEILMLAVDQLDYLADKMVFLGGCATGLLITDPAAPPIRVTRDVDAIVAVLDGRPEILGEVRKADSSLVRELSERFRILLQDDRFFYAVSGHMPSSDTSPSRVSGILKTMQKISEIK